LPVVSGTGDDAVGDSATTEWLALVGAGIFEGVVTSLMKTDRDIMFSDAHDLDLLPLKVIRHPHKNLFHIFYQRE